MKLTPTDKEFEEGFIGECLDRGFNVTQTDAFYKSALYAQAFDQPEFLAGFNEVVGPHRAANMSLLEKAACVKEYMDSLAE
jgi:hypothetical protein